ncbi:MAG TPA: sulfatase-like hydrolase/transferase, partial [Solirubrobacteraceae bacterium]|nr:sulfatase-like hydrolase/transferase [Solirubrobacteraceae bacterium]
NVPPTYIPPGWNEWDVTGWGYPEYAYNLNQNGRLVYYGPAPPPRANAANYLTDVLASRAGAFIERAASVRRPFFLEVATFAPHSPYTPAPRNAHDFPGLRAPRDPSFNAQNANPPDWLGSRRKLTQAEVAKIDGEYRMRAQAVEAVDRLVGTVEAELAARGLAANTYIVFSSDNGYHMGQHRLLPGKETAFDTDIRVPLIVAGPGVAPGRIVPNVAQNVDLFPTFVQLAGRRPSDGIDGHSLVALLRAASGPRMSWRTVALVEHHGPTDVGDPDLENGQLGGNPASYNAVRISDKRFGDAVYVEYTRNGGREYYNLDTDAFELHNTYKQLSASQRSILHRTLARLERCHNSAACWIDADPQPS